LRIKKDVFAGDVPKATTSLMWAGQRPADTRTQAEPSGIPAWKTIRRGEDRA